MKKMKSKIKKMAKKGMENSMMMMIEKNEMKTKPKMKVYV
jgi:hypothetical protein